MIAWPIWVKQWSHFFLEESGYFPTSTMEYLVDSLKNMLSSQFGVLMLYSRVSTVFSQKFIKFSDFRFIKVISHKIRQKGWMPDVDWNPESEQHPQNLPVLRPWPMKTSETYGRTNKIKLKSCQKCIFGPVKHEKLSVYNEFHFNDPNYQIVQLWIKYIEFGHHRALFQHKKWWSIFIVRPQWKGW